MHNSDILFIISFKFTVNCLPEESTERLKYIPFFIDYAELAAQVWAPCPYRACWWSTENDQHSLVPWDTVHSGYCLPEWRGKASLLQCDFIKFVKKLTRILCIITLWIKSVIYYFRSLLSKLNTIHSPRLSWMAKKGMVKINE